MRSTRRKVLRGAGSMVGLIAAAVAGGVGWLSWKSREDPLDYPWLSASSGKVLPLTPSCDSSAATPAQTEGPFYTPNTPKRTNLREPNMSGTPLLLEGYVRTTDCRAVSGAVLDVWSCDDNGVYDNDGYRLRGHQYTDADGRFRLETIRPAHYKGVGFLRTSHLHIKLQGPHTRLLTTQLYFPDDPHNANDGIFNSALLMQTERRVDGAIEARFDFVLKSTV